MLDFELGKDLEYLMIRTINSCMQLKADSLVYAFDLSASSEFPESVLLLIRYML